MIICPKVKCTGCWVCREACPKSCIGIKKDSLDIEYPYIDDAQCIGCGICKKVCPNNSDSIFHYPRKVYAAWSKDLNVRKSSASGGVATELYRYYLSQGAVATGVILDAQYIARYILLDNISDISKVRNSKYTYSDTDGIYGKIKESLDKNVEVLFIGLPCHVAALLNYLKKPYDNLLTVDIICHGVPPSDYLRQHIANIENSYNKNTAECTFRDPNYGTHNYVFALYDESQKCFYHKRVLSNDVYQLGYHKALIYRENCYQCRFARAERVSDLTIGDFSGLGMVEECEINSVNVSCVMVNTFRGECLVSALESVEILERPIEEALNYERQLKEPSQKHIHRNKFENLYKETKDFTYAAAEALQGEMIHGNLPPNVVRLLVKSIIRALLPARLRKFIKSRILK